MNPSERTYDPPVTNSHRRIIMSEIIPTKNTDWCRLGKSFLEMTEKELEKHLSRGRRKR